jgi:hypothetical protein
MAVTVTHTTAATQPDSGDGKISSNAWNEDHTVIGLGAAALADIGSGVGQVLDKASADLLYQATGAYLTGNQTITLSGDVSGSGATAITGTLATVNSNVGSFGSATQSLTATVDGKGRITAISAQTATPAFTSITSKPTTVAGYGITDAGYVVAQSAVAASHTGDTATTTLATITIPAAAMGANGVLAVTFRISRTGALNTMTTSATFGGTSVLSKTFGTTVTSEEYVLYISNRNSAASQLARYSTANNVAGVAAGQSTATIDTTASASLLIKGACTNAGDTITLESYQVLIYPKA